MKPNKLYALRVGKDGKSVIVKHGNYTEEQIFVRKNDEGVIICESTNCEAILL